MAKAILFSVDSSMNGPDLYYEYHLKYISNGRINISDFPDEIDTENVTGNLIISPTMANPDCTLEKTLANAKTHKKLIRTVNNSIGQLDLED